VQQLSRPLKDAIRNNSQQIISKIEVYDTDRSTLLDTITDGYRISFDAGRKRLARRSVTIDILNTDDQYTPDLSNLLESKFWADKWLKIYAGYDVIDGQDVSDVDDSVSELSEGTLQDVEVI